MRAQLLCLREYSDRQLAALADSVWAALSNACHYHSYDVEPTAAELRAWHDQVTDVCAALFGATAAAGNRDDDVQADSH